MVRSVSSDEKRVSESTQASVEEKSIPMCFSEVLLRKTQFSTASVDQWAVQTLDP